MRGVVPEHSLRNEGISALTITAIYLIAGGLWILFSDVLLHAMVADETRWARLQTFKGWFYVAATGLTLYFLISRSTRAVCGANEALRRNEDGLRTILNTIPALVFVTDADDRLLRFNDNFGRV